MWLSTEKNIQYKELVTHIILKIIERTVTFKKEGIKYDPLTAVTTKRTKITSQTVHSYYFITKKLSNNSYIVPAPLF